MSTNKTIEKNQIWLADLRGAFGSEQGGIRPVIIVQNNMGNKHSPTVSIAPLTSQINKCKLPTHVVLNETCLASTSVVLIEQTKTIDKKKLLKYMGYVKDSNIINKINKSIKIQMGINEFFNEATAFYLLNRIYKMKKAIKKFGEDYDLKSEFEENMKEYMNYCYEHNMNPKDIQQKYKNVFINKREAYSIAI